MFSREELFRLEPGNRTVLGNTSYSPVAVRFERQDAEEENVTVVVRYEAYLDDPDNTEPLIVEKELQLSVGYGQKPETSASEENAESVQNSYTWLYITGVIIITAAIIAVIILKKNKMEKNVRVAAVC